MTFIHEERVHVAASAAAVWALWSDPTTWASWDPAVEAVSIEFVAGAEGTMTLGGGFEVPVVLDVVDAGVRYVDRLTMGELTIRIDHVVADHEGGAAVVVSTTIEGPGADDVGPMVVTDAPVALRRLAEMAEALAP